MIVVSDQTLAVDETDDILDRGHGLGRDQASAATAFDQNRIDVPGIRHQALHLAGYRREFCDAEIDQRVLEAGKLPTAEFGEHRRLRLA